MAFRQSTGEVAVDTIGGEDERVSLGYRNNISLECRQLKPYNACAQQQRLLCAGYCVLAKQDTHYIPYA
jgi:hypothetical protein